jgi:hypothetical protein
MFLLLHHTLRLWDYMFVSVRYAATSRKCDRDGDTILSKAVAVIFILRKNNLPHCTSVLEVSDVTALRISKLYKMNL